MSQAVDAKLDIQKTQINAGNVRLDGEVSIPNGATGVVLFAHGFGSSRHRPRNQLVARTIRSAGYGTLSFDLLTPDEKSIENRNGQLSLDIRSLAERLVQATYWIKGQFDRVCVGYFGARTGAAAALVAAAELGEIVGAVVSREGRTELAADSLAMVKAPTLLIVGSLDYPVIDINRHGYAHLRCKKEIEVVPGAKHLFEEPRCMDQVAQLSAHWFQTHLTHHRRTPLSGRSPAGMLTTV